MAGDRVAQVPNIARLFVIRSQIARVLSDLDMVTAGAEYEALRRAYDELETAMVEMARKVGASYAKKPEERSPQGPAEPSH